MEYYTKEELKNLGFKYVGKNVKISNKSSIYNCDQIEIGDNSRIDDFCVISGKIKIGRNVHIAPLCLVVGGEKGIVFEDFSGLTYHVNVFTQSDGYSGKTLTNPSIPGKYKKEIKKEVVIEKHLIVKAGSIIMQGLILEDDIFIGALLFVRKSNIEWTIYLANPAKKIVDKKRIY